MSVEKTEIVIDFSEELDERLVHSLISQEKLQSATFVQGDKLPVVVYFTQRSNGNLIGKSIGGNSIQLSARYNPNDGLTRPTDLVFTSTLTGEGIQIGVSNGVLYGGIQYDSEVGENWTVGQSYYVTQSNSHNGAFFVVDEIGPNGGLLQGHISDGGTDYTASASITIQNPYGNPDITSSQTITQEFSTGSLLRNPPIDYEKEALFIADIQNVEQPEGVVFHTGSKEKKLSNGRYADQRGHYNTRNIIKNSDFTWNTGDTKPFGVEINTVVSGGGSPITAKLFDKSEAIEYDVNSGPASGLYYHHEFTDSADEFSSGVYSYLMLELELDDSTVIEPGHYALYFENAHDFGNAESSSYQEFEMFNGNGSWNVPMITVALTDTSVKANSWDAGVLNATNASFGRIQNADSRPTVSGITSGTYKYENMWHEIAMQDVFFNGEDTAFYGNTVDNDDHTGNWFSHRPKYVYIEILNIKKIKFDSIKLIKKTPMTGLADDFVLNPNPGFDQTGKKLVCTAVSNNYLTASFQSTNSRKYVAEFLINGITYGGNQQPSCNFIIEKNSTDILDVDLSSTSNGTIFSPSYTLNNVNNIEVSQYNHQYTKVYVELLSDGTEQYDFKIKANALNDQLEIIDIKLYDSNDLLKENLLTEKDISEWTASTGQEVQFHWFGIQAVAWQSGSPQGEITPTAAEIATIESGGLPLYDASGSKFACKWVATNNLYENAAAVDMWYKVSARLAPGAILTVSTGGPYIWLSGTNEAFISNQRGWTTLKNTTNVEATVDDWFFVRSDQQNPNSVHIFVTAGTNTSSGPYCTNFEMSFDYPRGTSWAFYQPRYTPSDGSYLDHIIAKYDNGLSNINWLTHAHVNWCAKNMTSPEHQFRYLVSSATMEKNVENEIRVNLNGYCENDLDTASTFPTTNQTEFTDVLVYNNKFGWFKPGHEDEIFGGNAITKSFNRVTATQYNDTESSQFRRYTLNYNNSYEKIAILPILSSASNFNENRLLDITESSIASEGNGVYLQYSQSSGITNITAFAGSQYNGLRRCLIHATASNFPQINSANVQFAVLVNPITHTLTLIANGTEIGTATSSELFPGNRFANNDEGGVGTGSASYALGSGLDFNGTFTSNFKYVKEPVSVNINDNDLTAIQVHEDGLAGRYVGVIDLDGAFIHAFFDGGDYKLPIKCDIQAANATNTEIATLAQFSANIIADVNFTGSSGAPPS